MKKASQSSILKMLAVIVVATGFSAETEVDQISIKIENGDSAERIITVLPQNEELKKDLSGGPYMLTVRVASTLPLLRNGIFLKSKWSEIPLNTDSPPSLSLQVFVADFEFVVVEISSIKHWAEWRETYLFQVTDSELVPVDAEKLGLATYTTWEE